MRGIVARLNIGRFDGRVKNQGGNSSATDGDLAWRMPGQVRARHASVPVQSLVPPGSHTISPVALLATM